LGFKQGVQDTKTTVPMAIMKKKAKEERTTVKTGKKRKGQTIDWGTRGQSRKGRD